MHILPSSAVVHSRGRENALQTYGTNKRGLPIWYIKDQSAATSRIRVTDRVAEGDHGVCVTPLVNLARLLNRALNSQASHRLHVSLTYAPHRLHAGFTLVSRRLRLNRIGSFGISICFMGLGFTAHGITI